MVDLVALLQPAQDRDGVLERGLADVDWLEAAFQRRVLLHVLAVFVECGRADAAQVPSGKGRLQHVRGVGRALGGSGADDGVQLVDEEDHSPLGLGHLTQHRLEAVLELAPVLRAGDQRSDVEGDHAAILQGLRDVAGHDSLGESLGDGGLADAGLADQHRVVLGAAGQHLDQPSDLVVPAHHRVELAEPRHLGEVAAELGQGLVLGFRILVGHLGAAANRFESLLDGLARCARFGQDAPGIVLLLRRDGQEQMLGRDVLVLPRVRLADCCIQHPRRCRAQLGLAAAGDLGKA